MNKVSLNEAIDILEAEDHNRAIDILARFLVYLDKQEIDLEIKLHKLDTDRNNVIELALGENLTAQDAYDLVHKIDHNFTQFNGEDRTNKIILSGATAVTN